MGSWLWGKKWWIVGIVALGGIAFWMFGPKKVEAPTTATVTRQDVSRTVSVTGRLIGESRVAVNFEANGRIKQILKRSGENVVAGEPIAKLDDLIAREEVARTEALLDQARAAAGGNIDAIREARVAVDSANDTEDETDDQQDQSVKTAEEIYKNAKDSEDATEDYYDEVVSVFGSGSVEAKSAKLQYLQAQHTTEQAKLSWDGAKRARDLALAQAKGAAAAAKARLETAQSQFTRAEIDSRVASAQATRDAAVAQLDKYTLRSPVTGTLGQINGRVGELSSAFTTKAFAMVTTSDFLIEAEVPEADITSIVLGQDAEVRFDSLDDVLVKAKVISMDIAPISNASDVVYYTVRLRVDVLDKRLKEGMSADVDIALATRQSVLTAPFRAIKKKDGKQYVNLWQNDQEKEVLVRTGLEGLDGNVEILEGIKEGDVVVVPDQKLFQ